MKTTHKSSAKDTTLRFSITELNLLTDKGFFEKKRKLTEKILFAFSDLESSYEMLLRNFHKSIPLECVSKRGKISKGENYLGLPYLVLDYPALFQKQDVFAFRTMFWWGHGFSFTFQTSGLYMDTLLPAIDSNLKKGVFNDCLICINTTQWEHHFESSNYISAGEYNSQSNDFIIESQNRGFFKIVKRLEVTDSPLLAEVGTAFMLRILKSVE